MRSTPPSPKEGMKIARRMDSCRMRGRSIAHLPGPRRRGYRRRYIMTPLSAPPGTMPLDILYLAWGRPQRPRANLIQTLHTVEALAAAGADARLYLPPLPKGFDMAGFLAGMGIRHPIDLRGSAALHRQWGGWPFMLLHRGELRRSEEHTSELQSPWHLV